MEGLTRVGVLRRERGLTQQELGRKSGLSRSFLSEVENANRVPSLSSLNRISAALGVMPIDVLLRDEHEISEKNENRTCTPDWRASYG
jgi:transcriptional regulator with XRE-family HTH domain